MQRGENAEMKCKHKWHVIGQSRDLRTANTIVTFLCDKCEKIKRVEIK